MPTAGATFRFGAAFPESMYLLSVEPRCADTDPLATKKQESFVEELCSELEHSSGPSGLFDCRSAYK